MDAESNSNNFDMNLLRRGGYVVELEPSTRAVLPSRKAPHVGGKGGNLDDSDRLRDSGRSGRGRTGRQPAVGGAAAWPLAAQPQQPAMPVIGFLSTLSEAQLRHLSVGFRRGLGDRLRRRPDRRDRVALGGRQLKVNTASVNRSRFRAFLW